MGKFDKKKGQNIKLERMNWIRNIPIAFMTILVGIALLYVYFVHQELSSLRNAAKNCQKILDSPSSSHQRVIVSSRFFRNGKWEPDDRWLDFYFGKIARVTYYRSESHESKDPFKLANKGNEALVYLTYIHDNYDNLPEYAIFLHSHLSSWHSKEIVSVIENLKHPIKGYANLNWEGKHGFCDTKETALVNGEFKDLRRILNAHWNSTLLKYLGPLPKVLTNHCCAQFVVTKERMRLRPKQFYSEMIHWILNSSLPDYDTSRLFEYTWGVIFGEKADVQCPSRCEITSCQVDSFKYKPDENFE